MEKEAETDGSPSPSACFDSGLGGLTAVRELMHLLPREDIVYFGDTARVPYGGRSPETILKFARQDMNFLCSFDLKAVVIACGTVSTTSLAALRREYDLPIIGVVGPTARAAARCTKNGKIGLIATAASIRSGAYEAVVSRENPAGRVYGKACPLFVPLVENGRFRVGDPVIEIVAGEYLQSMKDEGVDTLMLGCTHYPLLSDVIGKIMGPGVTLIDSGREAARALKTLLTERDLLSDAPQGDTSYFVSDTVDGFEAMASLFLRSDLKGMVQQINIEKY